MRTGQGECWQGCTCGGTCDHVKCQCRPRKRKSKPAPIIPTLDNGMGNEMIAIDFRETREKCLGYGGSPSTAGARAAQRVVFKLANNAGHILSQQGTESECAKCSAHGVVHQSDGLHAGPWQCTYDFRKECGT